MYLPVRSRTARASIALAAVFLCAVPPSPAVAAEAPAWRAEGPFLGTVVDVAFDARTPGLAYAAAANGGVFRSPDGGRSWVLRRPAEDEQPHRVARGRSRHRRHALARGRQPRQARPLALARPGRNLERGDRQLLRPARDPPPGRLPHRLRALAAGRHLGAVDEPALPQPRRRQELERLPGRGSGRLRHGGRSAEPRHRLCRRARRPGERRRSPLAQRRRRQELAAGRRAGSSRRSISWWSTR